MSAEKYLQMIQRDIHSVVFAIADEDHFLGAVFIWRNGKPAVAFSHGYTPAENSLKKSF